MKDVMVICPDARTSALFKLEAFDLAERGEASPYFRKQMAILEVVRRTGGIREDEVREKLARVHREEISSGCSGVVAALVEELEAIGYLKVEAGQLRVTKAGDAKLEDFKSRATDEVRKALEPEL
jgi:hypothetical protein